MLKGAHYLKLALLALVLCLGVLNNASAIELLETNFMDREVLVSETLIFHFDRQPDETEGQLRIMVGDIDMSALTSWRSSTELILESDVTPLPVGESEVVIYLAKEKDDWLELFRLALKVREDDGSVKSEWTPSLGVSVSSQWTSSESESYHDLDINGGLGGTHVKGDLQVSSNVIMQASSNQEKALRYDIDKVDAPKIDVAEYIIEAHKGETLSGAMGSISYGTNPMLVDSLATRGLMSEIKLSDQLDVSVAAMNSNAIVGSDNLTGLEDSDNRLMATTVGYELVKTRPGGFRIEYSYMSGVRNPTSNTEVTGLVSELEESKGSGIRVSGENESGRFKGNLALARSTFSNPVSPTDTAEVAVDTSTDSAYQMNLTYELLQDQKIIKDAALNLSTNYTHKKIDPLYKSLGVEVTPNIISDQILIDAQLGDVTLQLVGTVSEDDIDDQADILKTITHTSAISLGLPLSILLKKKPDIGPWLPDMNIVLEKVHRFAGNLPNSYLNDCAVTAKQLLNQFESVSTLNLDWKMERWAAGYGYSRHFQDDMHMQCDHIPSQQDITVNDQELMLSTNYQNGTAIQATAKFSENLNRVTSSKSITRGLDFNVSGPLTENWSHNINYSVDHESNSESNESNKGNQYSYQVNWRVRPSYWTYSLPAEVYFRYVGQDSVSEIAGSPSTSIKAWVFQTGVTVALF